MFWLLQQFLFLGGLDGILLKSIELFFNHQHPTSSDRFRLPFPLSILGLGTIGSVLSVIAARKVSAMGDDTSWSSKELNDSRSDKYLWVLTGLSIANLVWWLIMYYRTIG